MVLVVVVATTLAAGSWIGFHGLAGVRFHWFLGVRLISGGLLVVVVLVVAVSAELPITFPVPLLSPAIVVPIAATFFLLATTLLLLLTVATLSLLLVATFSLRTIFPLLQSVLLVLASTLEFLVPIGDPLLLLGLLVFRVEGRTMHVVLLADTESIGELLSFHLFRLLQVVRLVLVHPVSERCRLWR